MVTAASGARRAARLAGLGKEPPACLPPPDKVTFCSGSSPDLQPGWHLAGEEEGPHKGSGGAGCSGGRDARDWAGEGCGAPKQPHGSARNLLRAPGAAQGSLQMPLGIPSLRHPPAMARLDGSFTLCFEHAAQEESRDLPPRSRAPGVCLNFSGVGQAAPLAALAQLRHHLGTRASPTTTRGAAGSPRGAEGPVRPRRKAREPPSGESATYKFGSRSLLLFYY